MAKINLKKIPKTKSASYMKNVAKSFGYAIGDVLKDANPTITSIARNSKEYSKEIFGSMSDLAKDTKNYIAGSLDTKNDSFLKNTLDDLKSGEWYKQRSAFDLDFGEDDWDFDSSDDYNFDDSDDSDFSMDDLDAKEEKRSQQIISSVAKSSSSISKSFGYASAQSAKYIAESQRQSTKAMYALTASGFNQVTEAVMSVNNTITSFAAIAEPLSAHLASSERFFANTSLQLEQIRTTVEKIAENTNYLNPNNNKRINKSSPFYFDNIGEYISNNIKESTSTINSFIDMAKMMGGEKGKGASGAEWLVKGFVSALIPKNTKDAMKNFNEAISDSIKIGLTKAAYEANKKGGLLGELAKIFLPSMDLKTSVKTGGYEKGPVPFDGITKKAIVSVIPRYLAEITSLLGGSGKLYNYETGKYESINDIKKNKEDKLKRAARQVGGDLQYKMFSGINGNPNLTEEQKTARKEQIESFFMNVLLTGNTEYAEMLSDSTLLKSLGIDKKTAQYMKKTMTKLEKSKDYNKQHLVSRSQNSVMEARYNLSRDFSREELDQTSMLGYLEDNFESMEAMTAALNKYQKTAEKVIKQASKTANSSTNELKSWLSANYNGINVSDQDIYNMQYLSEEDRIAYMKKNVSKQSKNVINKSKDALKEKVTGKVNDLNKENPEDASAQKKGVIQNIKDFKSGYDAQFAGFNQVLDTLSHAFNDLFYGSGGFKDRLGSFFNTIKNALFGKLREWWKESDLGKKVKDQTQKMKTNLFNSYKKARNFIFGEPETEMIPSADDADPAGQGSGLRRLRRLSGGASGNYEPYDFKKRGALGLVKDGATKLASGVTDFVSHTMGDPEKDKKIINGKIAEAMKEAGDAKGAMFVGGLAGAGVSIITGAMLGPLAGAAIGAGTGLLFNSQKVQEALFGKPDKDGNYSKPIGNFVMKQLPDIGKGTALGAVAGTFLGSPLIGAVVGGMVGFAKQSDTIKNALFGEYGEDGKRKGGVISKDFMDKVKHGLPSMAAGGIAGLGLSTLIGGPFGLLGNVLIGSAVGLATSESEGFHKYLFGDGKDDKGLAGLVKDKVLNRLDNIFNNTANILKNGLNRLGKSIKRKVERGATALGNFLQRLGGGGKGPGALLAKGAGNLLKNIVTFGASPLALLEYGTRQLAFRTGANVYDNKLKRNMTAEERLAFQQEHGSFKGTRYDNLNQILAGTQSKDELDAIEKEMQIALGPDKEKAKIAKQALKSMGINTKDKRLDSALDLIKTEKDVRFNKDLVSKDTVIEELPAMRKLLEKIAGEDKDGKPLANSAKAMNSLLTDVSEHKDGETRQELDDNGNPVTYTYSHGEWIIDQSDSQTKESMNIKDILNKRSEKQADDVSSILEVIRQRQVDEFNGEEGEEKKSFLGNLMDKLKGFFTGPIGIAIASILGGVLVAKFGPIIAKAASNVVNGIGKVIGNFKLFKGNDTQSAFDDNTSMVGKVDGEQVFFQTNPDGTIKTDADGNYITKDGQSVSADSVTDTKKIGSNTSATSQLKKNIVKSLALGRGNVFTRGPIKAIFNSKLVKTIFSHTKLGKGLGLAKKAAIKAANGIGTLAKSIGPKIAATGLGKTVMTGVAKALGFLGTIMKAVPGLKNIAAWSDDIAKGIMKEVGEEVAKKSATKAGAKALGKMAALANPIGIAVSAIYIAGKATNAWGDAESILGITEEATTGQRAIAAMISILNSLIPGIGDLIPDKVWVNILINIFSKIPVTKDWMKGIEEQREAAQREVDAFNEANGTDLSIEEYNQQEYDSEGNYKGVKGGWFTKLKARWKGDKTAKKTAKKKASEKTGVKEEELTTAEIYAARRAGGASGFVSQFDPRYQNYKISGRQFGDKGCGPAVAAMAANAFGKNMSVASAVNSARGYETSNGVTVDYFTKALGSKGINTEIIAGGSSADIYNRLANGEKVVLLGRDPYNTSKANSPFGPNNHYVLANGLDRNGNVIVSDPELKAPTTYNPSILRSASVGIAGGRSGITNHIRHILRKYSGGDSVALSDIPAQVWNYLINNGFSEQSAAGILGNLKQETGVNPSVKTSVTQGIACWDKVNGVYPLEEAAKAAGKEWTDLKFQLDYLMGGLENAFKQYTGKKPHYYKNGEWCWWPEKVTLEEYKKMTDIAKATEIFERTYERASKPKMENRIKYANEFYTKFTGQPGQPIPENANYSAANLMFKSAANAASSAHNAINDTIREAGSVAADKIKDFTHSDKSSGSIFDILSSVSDAFMNFGKKKEDEEEVEEQEASADSNTDGETSTAKGDTSVPSSSYSSGKSPLDFMKSIAGKITYSMKGPRDPEKGSADCSSTVNWAVKKATGIDVGNSTVAQYTNPNLSTVWYDNGKYASEIPAGTQPNDLLFFARPNSAFTEGRTDRVGHVEIYQGDGKMIGHGSGYGPKEKNVPLGSKGYLVKVARVKQVGANSGIIRNYQQLANVSGGSSGILINSRVGSRNYMTPTNFMGYSGGDSALAYETTNMLNGAKERIKRSNGIDPKLVAQLLEAITKLLNGISDNTAPVKSIYELLKVKMATGGDSGLGNNSSKPTVINNNKIVAGGDSEVDEGISSLVGVLAELAKG